MKFLRTHFPKLALLALGFLAGWLIFGGFGGLKTEPQSRTDARPDCSQSYPFINKDLDCEKIDEAANRVDELHGTIAKIISQEKTDKNIINASVFYRDLKMKRWFGINDLDEYFPASLLKLPAALVYFKIAELQPNIFDQRLKVPAEGEATDNSDQQYPPQDPLVPGNTYTIKEMVRHMLLYSDNAAFGPLVDSAGVVSTRVFADLAVYVPPKDAGDGAWRVTPRSISNIFRTLYNASYINLQSSNEVLEMLSQTTFDKGIVAGVPKGVKVAHKFGEATAMEDETRVHSVILNDCGIVYKPDQPYIICVMTEGNDFKKLESVIQKIAGASYDAL